MKSSRILLFFFYSIFIHFVKPNSVQRDPYVVHNCSTTGNVTSNSTYRANLNNLLSSLSSKTPMVNGFYNFSAGENSDKVNAIALCKADSTSTECRSCVNISAHQLLLLCPNQKEGITWYVSCTVRYSDRFIFGSMESEPTRSLVSSWTDSVKQFNRELNPLLDSLRYKAAGFSGKFATGSNANNTNQNYTIYALLQCTPDLVDTLCQNCLTDAQIYITQCCNDMRGARVLKPSCNLRYETSRFYGNTTQDEPPPGPPPSLSPPPPPLPPPAKGTRFPKTYILILLLYRFSC